MRVFFSVGEPSGDLHGSNLIRELAARRPECEFVGYGGPKMRAAGCELHADLTELAIMGFVRVVPHLVEFWQFMRRADIYFRQHRPDVVVLIDYPGFNWWIARRAKAHGIPVVYYGTPQIWAWANHRVRKLRRLVDLSLCKLPFEPEWYRERGCAATYVGHPYFDEFLQTPLDTSFVHQLGDAPRLTILPGSRRHEVSANLPAFLRTIDYVAQSVPETQFAIASYNEHQAEMARSIVSQHRGMVVPEIYVGRTRELIHAATCCLACSGSVSLELLHEAKPTVIHYQINRFYNTLQQAFRRCKFITLVNLLSSDDRFRTDTPYDPDDSRCLAEAPFPEYLTVHDRSAHMAHHLVRWLGREDSRREAIAMLEPLRQAFVRPGASKRAAEFILSRISDSSEPTRLPQGLPSSAKVA